MSKKTDPRIVRTRQLLRNAFIELVKEMNIEKITVNRLAEQATINRVTFYLHYRDIPDMQEKMADEMVEEISNILDEAEKRGANKALCTLEYIADNAEFYKVVLTSKGIPTFRERLLTFLAERIVSREKNKEHHLSPHDERIEEDFLVWYESSAFIGTIIAWLKNDRPYSPEYMAKQFYLLRYRGEGEGRAR